MSGWEEKTFKTRADLLLRLMNLRWANTERHVNGMIDSLKTNGITTGSVLDLCCGNGRISTYFALKDFKATGVDFSPTFIDDAEKKAKENGVSDNTSFILGDVRELDKSLGKQVFDVVVNAWTSIGYSTWDDDVSIFKQARNHAKKDSILFIIDTMHQARASRNPKHTSFFDYEDRIMLERGSYDILTSRMNTIWRFYKKKEDDLIFDDQCEYDIRIYSLSELNQLLTEAGWKIENYYGDITSKQPMSPYTGMNIIAKPG